MENKRGLYQEELCRIFSNYELPEDVSLTEQTRRYLHEAINKLYKSQIVKVYQLIRGMLGGAA